jgi:hypothetical protein
MAARVIHLPDGEFAKLVSSLPAARFATSADRRLALANALRSGEDVVRCEPVSELADEFDL